jgi:hypothetical protein
MHLPELSLGCRHRKGIFCNMVADGAGPVTRRPSLCSKLALRQRNVLHEKNHDEYQCQSPEPFDVADA